MLSSDKSFFKPKEKFEDTKGVFRANRKSKTGQIIKWQKEKGQKDKQ